MPHLRKLTIYFYVDVDPSLNMDDDDDDANYARFILAVRTAIRKVDQLSTLGREFLEHLTDWKLKLHYMADAIQRATPEGSEVIGAIRPRPSHVLMEAEKLFSDMFNEKLSCQKLTWVPVIPSRRFREEHDTYDHKGWRNEAYAHWYSPLRSAVIDHLGAVVDAICDKNAQSDEELVSTDHGPTDLARGGFYEIVSERPPRF